MSVNCMKCGKGVRVQPYGYCEECTKPYKLVEDLKEHLDRAGRDKLGAAIQAVIDAAYDKGYQDALLPYAYMKDGVSYVGNCGTTLVDALNRRKADKMFYDPKV